MLRFLFFLVFFLASLQLFAQVQLNRLAKQQQVAGLQVSVVQNGREQVYSSGYSNVDTKEKITANTVFQAASLSKVVLAYITLRLADRGKLSLDTPLFRYYPYPRLKDDSAAQAITARMVLHHTTGFPNWAGNPLSKDWEKTALRTRFQPGMAWSYSGEGFMFLQFAIQTIMNESLEAVAVKEVFGPLQMKSSSFVWQPHFDSTAAYGHNNKGEVVERSEFLVPAGAYSLLTTAHDYQLFLQAFLKGEGLYPATHSLLLKDAVLVKTGTANKVRNPISWGLGIGREQNALGTAFWHWGDNGSFKCFFLIYPKTGNSMVCLTNSENGLALMQPLFRHFFGSYTWWAVSWLKTAFR